MKKQATFLLTFFISVTVQSQNPQWGWAKSAGGNDEDYGKCIAAHPNGNIYVIGNFHSQTITFGNYTLQNTGPTGDIFIVEMDTAGNVIWAKDIGGSGTDKIEDMAIDQEGNILITGYFDGDTLQIGSDTLTNSNVFIANIFIAKFDSSGNALWARSAGESSYDYSLGISADIDGNIYVTGSFESASITFDNITLINPAANLPQGFIVKYNASGMVIWAKSFGGNTSDYGSAVCTDAQSNIFVTGWFDEDSILFDNLSLYNHGTGTRDVFIVKYDSSGTALSAKNFGGTDLELPSDICSDPSGNIYLTGTYASTSVTFGAMVVNGSPGFGDLFIIKYDNALNEHWILHGGGTAYNRGWRITSDAFSNLYVCGVFNNSMEIENIILTSAGPPDPFMVHCDSAGNLLWAISAPGEDDADAAFAVAVDGGVAYYTGLFQSRSIEFGNTTLVNVTSSAGDAFISRLDSMQMVSMSETKNSSGVISLTPNPFSNDVMISFYVSHPESTSLKIFDMRGCQVFISENYSWLKGENHFTWNALEENAGVYLLQIESEGEFRSEKLILMK